MDFVYFASDQRRQVAKNHTNMKNKEKMKNFQNSRKNYLYSTSKKGTENLKREKNSNPRKKTKGRKFGGF